LRAPPIGATTWVTPKSTATDISEINEKKIGAFMQEKMAQLFMEAGAIAVEKGPPGTMGPSTHACGGTRMGDNRETNVVDRWGFSHEVPNLGVRRIGHGYERGPQPDAHGPGAGMADRRAHNQELEGDRKRLIRTTAPC